MEVLYPRCAGLDVTLVLANAMHIRTIPGRKSDTNDATWIADLLALGLIRSSFVRPAPLQDLRDLTRTRTQLVREAARHTQRIQKTLEDANIKLTEVIRNASRRPGPNSWWRSTAGHTPPSLHAPAASDADRRPRHCARRY